jgi:transketolase
MLLYSLLHLTGYDLSLDEIKRFRQWGSPTPGHPERHPALGIETTTGPLGQGVANSVGMALAERWLAHRFNRHGHEIIHHYTYAICSDGDLMEGISHEVAEFAGHQRLGRLIWMFDDNRITIDGSTDLASSIDQTRRFEAYGWHVQEIADGNGLDSIDVAIRRARQETERPSLIRVRTTIAFGSPNKAGHESAHGSPLGEEEVLATKRNLGYPSLEPFHIEPEALAWWRQASRRGEALEAAWRERFERYRAVHPDLAGELEGFLSGALPEGWDGEVPDWAHAEKAEATRASSGKVLQGLAARVGNLVGGSADLAPSNNTSIANASAIQAASPGGRNLHFGVREHAMGGLMNGMALHGGVLPYGGTFLVFSDYMRPAVRLAAMMELPVRYVFTHDSVGLGEDGPTHQPIEQLSALRAIPGLMDLRPADAAETAEAWRAAFRRTDGPAFLALTRHKVPPISRSGAAGASGLSRGAYIIAEATDQDPEVILIASGSEVHLSLAARDILESEGTATRVVSMPSWFLFRTQSEDYRKEVLPPEVVARVSIEAGSTHGWALWIGSQGVSIGIDHFGASAPAGVLFERLGFTPENIARTARDLLATLAPATDQAPA